MVSLLLSFLVVPCTSRAGSLMLGVKGWYAFWNGWPHKACNIVDNAVEKGIINGLYDAGATTADSDVNSKKETGNGFLAGPILAYQTDDRKWSFSLAFMYFSTFKYETDSSGTYSATMPVLVTGNVDLSYSIELKRREIDLAVSRSITSWMKIFGGYKYTRIDEKLDIRGSLLGPIVSPISSDTEINSYAHIPTMGVGIVFPLSESIFVGLQAGVLYLIPNSKEKTTDNIAGTTTKESTEFNNSFGVNMEVMISLVAFESVMVQLGYRYQGMLLDAKATDANKAYSVWDSFHGVTLSALYLFNI